MKTFEGSSIHRRFSLVEEPRVIFPMYLLRAVAVTLVLFLLIYITGRVLYWFYTEFKFTDFVFMNILAFIALSLFLFLLQALFYAYRVRRKASFRRSTGELIVGYALPIIGIITAIYAAYAIGAM
jgi:hypothetical protein